MHEVVHILNVGQGDSFLIKPYLQNTVLLIDTGPQGSHIGRYIDDEDIHLVITHHHSDHIGGLKNLIREKGDHIRKFYLPAQYNELVLITEAILNLRSRGLSKESENVFSLFESIRSDQKVIFEATEELNSLKVVFLYEGAKVEKNYKCLNPPLFPLVHNWADEIDHSQFIQSLHSLFQAPFADRLSKILFLEYQTANESDTNRNNQSDLIISGSPYEKDHYSVNRSFILQFLISNMKDLEAFHNDPSYKNVLRIYRSYTSLVHDCCIVLKAFSESKAILFTSDASKKVLHRLLNTGNLRGISILQIPHHGSIYNIDADILKRIKPEEVFISHGNRKFGRSSDSHPDTELLNMLLENNIRILLTNDVVKNHVTLMKKDMHRNSMASYLVIET